LEVGKERERRFKRKKDNVRETGISTKERERRETEGVTNR
jgi:hypothetical protein